MPKKYSDTEKDNIRKDLIKLAERSLFSKGPAATSVDELVSGAGIPKGTFYLFYKCKEDLYLDTLSSFREEMQEKMLARLQELDENHIVTSLTEVFMLLVENVWTRGIHRLLLDQNAMYISRKAERGAVEKEAGRLYDFFDELFGYFAIDDKNDIAAFRGAWAMIIHSMHHARMEEKPLAAWRTLVRGLMLQLVGE